MGRWDFNALEMHEGETPEQVMGELGFFEGERMSNWFRAYHVFQYEGKKFLHVGWNNGNFTAHSTLVGFAQQKNRIILSRFSNLSELKMEEVKDIFYKDREPDFPEAIWAQNYEDAM